MPRLSAPLRRESSKGARGHVALTTRHLAYQAGRKFVRTQSKKPTQAKVDASCPYVYTPAGTPAIDQRHENGRRTAWLRGAAEALVEHVAPSKRPKAVGLDRRAAARADYRLAEKLGAHRLAA